METYPDLSPLASGRLDETLLNLWLHFGDHALLNEAEQWFNEQRNAYNQRLNDYLKVLSRGEIAPRNIEPDRPLALMEAIDRHLYIHRRTKRLPETWIKRGDAAYLIQPRRLPRGHAPNYARKMGSLQAWVKHHWILPQRVGSLTIGLRQAKDRLSGKAQALLHRGEARLFVGRFLDGVRPDWVGGASGFRAFSLTDKPRRRASVEALLKQAAEAEIDILVLPELTLCPGLRQEVARWLRDHPAHPFSLLLPGSFHQQEGDAVYNYAELKGPLGETVLTHRKFTTFGTINAPERIDQGRRIELLDTPAGLVAIPICLDYCDERKGALWRDLGIDWALVPSFGEASTLHAHESQAKATHRAHATVSAIANQHPEAVDADQGFVYPTETGKEEESSADRCVVVDLG